MLLSPARGWEDISEAARTPEEIQRRGFAPWIGICAAGEFMRLFHESEATFTSVLQSAIAIAGSLFISVYIGRLFLDLTMPRHVNAKLNVVKVSVFTYYTVGMIGFYSIISNTLPASMTFLHFLPFLSLLIIFKSTRFLDIPKEKTVTFMCLASVAVIILPIATSALLSFII